MKRLLLGLDLGTTGLAGKLWTECGELLAEAAVSNPQQQLGADVIQRMDAALAGAAAELQQLLVTGINQLIGQLLECSGCQTGQLQAVAAAANPVISHFLAGRSVAPILYPPHRPSFRAGDSLDAATLGLDLPGSLYLLPLVSGYLGGDLLALLLGSPPEAGPTLYLDLGTNAELALWDGQSWLATSVAAGPAFEAGNLSCGMNYGPAAVTGVRLSADRLQLQVVDNLLPQGFCGSGFFHALSCALQAGLVASDGRIRLAGEVADNLSRYLAEAEHGAVLRLYRDASRSLDISQADVRAFQLAKGAVKAGVACLLDRAGLHPGQLQAVRIAGALGGNLPSEALKGVAMVPENVLEKCRFLPGGVLSGTLAVLSRDDGQDCAEELARQVKAFPLSGTPAFEKAFLTALDFSQNRIN